MKVDIWSDVVCPWCYVGKRRFEAALAEFAHRDQVEVTWRAFELDPRAPRRRQGAYAERLASKYGMSVEQARGSIDHMVSVGEGCGIEFRFDASQPGNTFVAHRLIHLASTVGLQDRLTERLFAAYFTEGVAVGDAEALAAEAVHVGLEEGAVRELLAGDRFALEVRDDEALAASLQINAVPFFVFESKYAVPGAQSPAVLLQALEDAWRELAPLGEA